MMTDSYFPNKYHQGPPPSTPTMTQLYDLLTDVNRRLIRTETRVVKLMAQNQLDSDGYPQVPAKHKTDWSAA